MQRPVPFLVVLAAIGTLVAALAIKAPAIERGLEDRAVAALAGTGMRADVDGLNATLIGVALSERHQEKALIRLAALDGLEVLNDHSTLPPSVSPYATSATRYGDGRIVLEGSAPDEAAIGDLIQVARSLDGVSGVTNLMRPGFGAPPNWAEAAYEALAALDTLESGRVTMIDADVWIDGLYSDARASTAFEALNRPGWRVHVMRSPFAELEETLARVQALDATMAGVETSRATLQSDYDTVRAALTAAETEIADLKARLSLLPEAPEEAAQ